jgi:hypothetical protein
VLKAIAKLAREGALLLHKDRFAAVRALFSQLNPLGVMSA